LFGQAKTASQNSLNSPTELQLNQEKVFTPVHTSTGLKIKRFSEDFSSKSHQFSVLQAYARG